METKSFRYQERKIRALFMKSPDFFAENYYIVSNCVYDIQKNDFKKKKHKMSDNTTAFNTYELDTFGFLTE